jgi:DMSO/TMAO reductase YedYZ molybdopterin-dependent catalytic subunit
LSHLPRLPHSPEFEKSLERRRFIQAAGAGSVVLALGGVYVLSDELTREAQAQTRADGRPRLPPGQRVIEALRPMGGEPGDPSPAAYRLRVHGAVEAPYELTFAELLALPQTEQALDVHCVTTWSVLGAKFRGVKVADLAERAKPQKTARYVIFEAAHGYTSNISLRDALKPTVMVAHQLNGAPLGRAHGAPVRAIVPDFYFWKSAKWLTGIRFSDHDEPGYWETRGYNNHADPWRTERYA